MVKSKNGYDKVQGKMGATNVRSLNASVKTLSQGALRAVKGGDGTSSAGVPSPEPPPPIRG
jgi:hypothetical protein